jgi:protein AATF/BFR2
MAVSKGRNRASELEELVDAAPKGMLPRYLENFHAKMLTVPADFDPEADIPESDSDASGDDDEQEDKDAGARDHYAPVGKSKLRKPKEVALGPQYSGSRVTRDAIEGEEDDDDDPFARGFDDEDSEEEEDAVDSEDDDEELEDGTDATDMSDEEDEDDAAEPQDDPQDRAELRKMMATEQKAVAATISAANKQDAEKGRAVKRQRTTFDSLLNTRIKMQKSLVATNTLVAPTDEGYESQISEAQDALDAAEAAAYNLWSSLTAFRDELTTARTGEKRKRPTFSAKTPTEKLWAYTQEQEEQALPQRNTVLQKWSVKARGVTAQPQSGRLNNTQQATIIDVMNEHLTAPDRLLKRVHTPRSCAPVQLAARVLEDPKIYDDADFYGLLLKELLEAKSASSEGLTAATNLDLNNMNTMRREAKTKKNVDTKASKGRKLKYTVHEKLQNFMAPEDRCKWGERQTDELFGSLFGQRLQSLAEGLGEDDEEMADGDKDAADEEAGLMMFRQ